MVVFTGGAGKFCVKGQGKFDVNYEDHRRTGLCLVRQAALPCKPPLLPPALLKVQIYYFDCRSQIGTFWALMVI